ncbi:hypothetical protein K501DRAFT_278579 [Backusella circina FSU 941]|nr:hypothetical protein K501DRAFT_278579 [Backusella circina FSU 941]
MSRTERIDDQSKRCFLGEDEVEVNSGTAIVVEQIELESNDEENDEEKVQRLDEYQFEKYDIVASSIEENNSVDHYLAECQKTELAVTAVRTDEEVKLYNLLIADEDERREIEKSMVIRFFPNTEVVNEVRSKLNSTERSIPSCVANKRPCPSSLGEQHKNVVQMFSFESNTSIYKPPLPDLHGTNNQIGRLVSPDQPNGTLEQPKKKRKRRTYAVCSEKDGLCGSGDKRELSAENKELRKLEQERMDAAKKVREAKKRGDQLELSRIDTKKKQVLVSGSDPGVVSTTVVHTSTLEYHIRSINRFVSLISHPNTVDTVDSYSGGDDHVSLNVASKAVCLSNLPRPHQLKRQKKNNAVTKSML